MRYRGVSYPYPLAFFLLDVFNGQRHECFALVWDQERVARGIPSVFL